LWDSGPDDIGKSCKCPGFINAKHVPAHPANGIRAGNTKDLLKCRICLQNPVINGNTMGIVNYLIYRMTLNHG
jgi:hypothetical protein